jgi:hypothetical protein
MKRCSYCGAEYPDEIVECPVDQTPLNKTKSESESNSVPAKKGQTLANKIFAVILGSLFALIVF